MQVGLRAQELIGVILMMMEKESVVEDKIIFIVN